MSETKIKIISHCDQPNTMKYFKFIPEPATDGFTNINHEKKGTSNGFMTIISDNILNDIKVFMRTVHNPYIMKYLSLDLKLVIIFLYIPTLNSTDYYKNPIRENIVKEIYKQWDIILTTAKALSLKTASLGDLNGRMPSKTNDHDDNYNGIQLLEPFIELHNLKIVT
eukprot:888524_1